MLKVLSSILCDLDPKVKVIGQKAGICDGLPSTSALVVLYFESETVLKFYNLEARSPDMSVLLIYIQFSYFTIKTYVLGAQKNCHIKMVLLST